MLDATTWDHKVSLFPILNPIWAVYFPEIFSSRPHIYDNTILQEPRGCKMRAPGFIEQIEGKLVPPLLHVTMLRCTSSPYCWRLTMNNRAMQTSLSVKGWNIRTLNFTQRCMMMNHLCTKYCRLRFISDEGVCVCVCMVTWLLAMRITDPSVMSCHWLLWPYPSSALPNAQKNASLIQKTSLEFLHGSCWCWQTRVPRLSKTTGAFVGEYRVPPLRDGQRSVKPFFKMADASNARSPCLFPSVPPRCCSNKNWFWRAEAYWSAMHAPLMLINNLRGWVECACAC